MSAMLPSRIALVPADHNVQVNPAEVTRVASALQKQVVRDFGPVWGVNASVDAFVQLEQVPSDYWSILVVNDVAGGAGVHSDDPNLPNGGEIVRANVKGSVLVKTKYQAKFDNGILTEVKANKPSEPLAWATLPLSLLNLIGGSVGNFFHIRLQTRRRCEDTAGDHH